MSERVDAVPGETSKKKPSWFRRHKILTALGVLFLLGVIATATGKKDPTPSTAAGANATAVAPAPSSARATATANPSPTKTVFAPVVYTGSGDDVIKLNKPETGPVITYVKGNASAGFFAVEAEGGEKQLLVNTTDAYEGVRPLDFRSGETATLKVSAKGSWRVELRSLRSAPTFDASTSGTGDAVVTYTGPAGVAAIKGNPSGSFFAVETYGNSRDLLVNTTDVYAGRVPIKKGGLAIVVTATGPWSIAAS